MISPEKNGKHMPLPMGQVLVERDKSIVTQWIINEPIDELRKLVGYLKVNTHIVFPLREFAETTLEQRETARRHTETIQVANTANRIAKWAFVVAAVALIASATQIILTFIR